MAEACGAGLAENGAHKKGKAKRMYLGLFRNARALYELKERELLVSQHIFNMSILRVSACQGDF